MNRYILSLFMVVALLMVVCAAKEHKEEDDGHKHHKDKDKAHGDDKKHEDNKDHDHDHEDDEEEKHDKVKDAEDDDEGIKKHDKDKDHEEDEERPVKKWTHHFTSKYRRPLDLHIRVPFFTLFLKRDHTGPSKLGLQVFPDYHQHDHQGSLVDIHHRWWKK